jgi:hypothetical protein
VPRRLRTKAAWKKYRERQQSGEPAPRDLLNGPEALDFDLDAEPQPWHSPPITPWRASTAQACVIGSLGFYHIGNTLYVAIIAPGSKLVITIDLEELHETA